MLRLISIGDRSRWLAQRPAVGNVGVFRFGEQVSPVVIGIDDRFVQYAVILFLPPKAMLAAGCWLLAGIAGIVAF